MPLLLRFAYACLLTLLVLDARAALALAPQPFALSWVREPGAEACSTGHRLATLVTYILGPVLATPDDAELAIEGSVRKDADAWRARIAVSDRSGQVLGERALSSTGPSCAALDAQVLLVIAFAIDPEIALDGLSSELFEQLASSGDVAEDLLAELRKQVAPEQAKPAQAKPAPRERAPARVAAAEPKPRPARAPREDHHVLGVWLGPRLALGHLPSPVLGAGFGLELRPLPRWALGLDASWLAPSTVVIHEPGVRRASARFELQALAIMGCGAPLLDRSLRLDTCAGVALERRHAASEGLANARAQTSLGAIPRVATALSYLALRPWALTASVALDVPLSRPRFSYRAQNASARRTVFQPSVVALSLWLALGVEI
jgi:hypothetical protein